MKLHDIEFGNVFNASGARNFYGDGYWFHDFMQPFGLNWTGSTFVAKTTTIEERPGNMPLWFTGWGWQPIEFRPKCIKVNFWDGVVLNAVGLSGPGLDFLLHTFQWQERTEPFIISFMAVNPTLEERLGRFAEFVRMMRPKIRPTDDEILSGSIISAPIAIQINLSCPNVGLDPSGLMSEAEQVLDIISPLGVPLILKFNALVGGQAVAQIAEHPACSAVCISNTIPWGKIPDKINWKKYFGETSPLAEMGGGGLSGKPLLPIVREWIKSAYGIRKPIIAGGGILSAEDAISLIDAGASAVELGSVAILRPWRVAGIIRAVNNHFSKKKP